MDRSTRRINRDYQGSHITEIDIAREKKEWVKSGLHIYSKIKCWAKFSHLSLCNSLQNEQKKKKTVCLLEQSYKNAEAHYFALLFINAGKLSIFNVCYQSN